MVVEEHLTNRHITVDGITTNKEVVLYKGLTGKEQKIERFCWHQETRYSDLYSGLLVQENVHSFLSQYIQPCLHFLCQSTANQQIDVVVLNHFMAASQEDQVALNNRLHSSFAKIRGTINLVQTNYGVLQKQTNHIESTIIIGLMNTVNTMMDGRELALAWQLDKN